MSNLTSAQYLSLEHICVAIAQRNLGHFRSWPSISLQDLIQVALCGCTESTLSGALKAHNRYKPPTSYNVWCGRAANAALIDYHRQLSMPKRLAPGLESIESATFAFAGPNQNDDFMESVPARLNRKGGADLGARAYAQALSYREEHGLSWNGLWSALWHDGALRRLFGFSRPPARSSLLHARVRLRKWANNR